MNSEKSPEELLVKSRKRVIDHGEVFTPEWMVKDMLGLLQNEVERVDSRFLEPACGSGNFLIPVLTKKLDYVHERYGKNNFEKKHYALLALMSLYGIELLYDNVLECRSNLFNKFDDYFGVIKEDTLAKSAKKVLELNIINGNALSLTTSLGEPIIFSEWSYLGKGKYKRRDFSFDSLTQMSTWEEDTLFGDREKASIFTPLQDFSPMTMNEIWK